jgi:hypothetical protein
MRQRYEVPEHLERAYGQYIIPDYIGATEVDPDGFTAAEKDTAKVIEQLIDLTAHIAEGDSGTEGR